MAILNASGADGEAKTISRIVANMGGEVRMMTNREEQTRIGNCSGRR